VPEWLTPSTQVPIERVLLAVLTLRVAGQAVAV
jgi:hypothetical protein